MAGAPLKPWERVGTNSQQSALTSLTNEMASGGMGAIGAALEGATPSNIVPPRTAPPPVPARPPTSTLRSSMYGGGYGTGSYGTSGYGMSGYGTGGYGGMYGGLGGYGGYSSYGGIGGYGGYGGGYGGYGGGMYGMNRFGGGEEYGGEGSFAQQAELSSRSAFQSIESVVQTVGSVAMMLDSTFQALYNSFRAVLGVADQFSRMRVQMTQIFSALAIWRGLRWLVQRVLAFLRLREAPIDDVWVETARGAGAEMGELAGLKGTKRSNWPVILFFAIVLGGPYLLWRLLNSMTGKTDDSGWKTGETEHFLGSADYDYESDRPDELSFRRGQKIIIAPKELQPRLRGWLLACIDGKRTGIVPANYVRILGRRQGSKQGGLGLVPKQTQPLPNQSPAPQNPPELVNEFSADFETAFTPQQQQFHQQQQQFNASFEMVTENDQQKPLCNASKDIMQGSRELSSANHSLPTSLLNEEPSVSKKDSIK